MPTPVYKAYKNREEFLEPGQVSPPLRFFAQPIAAGNSPSFANTLILDDGAERAEQPDGFTYQFTDWSYNDFTIQTEVPSGGWLRFHLLCDPLWEIRLDGARVEAHPANHVCTAIEVSPGSHRIELSYRPLGRRLFGTAKIMLLICLAVQGWVALRKG
jgi:hypothetical protein